MPELREPRSLVRGISDFLTSVDATVLAITHRLAYSKPTSCKKQLPVRESGGMWNAFKESRWAGTPLLIIWFLYNLPTYIDDHKTNIRTWRTWREFLRTALESIDLIGAFLIVMAVAIFFRPELSKSWQNVVSRKRNFRADANPITMSVTLSQATGSTVPPSCWFRIKRFFGLHRERTAEERVRRLRRQWESAPGNGRKAARLMLEADKVEAEEIFQDFSPFDDDQQPDEVTKCYRWVVGYAWACRLALAREFHRVDEILNEADFCAGFWDGSVRNQDSKSDYQKFFVEPGGAAAMTRWREGGSLC